MKFLFVTGGVISGIGKGTVAASINLLMQMRRVKTDMIKFDGYYNYSAGTINPYEHGNIVVLDDGSECDLDMAHYEFLGNANLNVNNIYTSGKLIKEIIDDEIEGKWLGKTVQFIPHFTQRIQDKLINLAKDVELVICEIGGTVSDDESRVFYHAIREIRRKVGSDNVIILHVSLILYLNVIKEFKTKPLQIGIESLRRFGLDVDILLCRSEKTLPDKILDKISNLTGIEREAIFDAPDVKSIYEVPISLYDRHIDDFIADRFKLRRTGVRIHKYRELVEKYTNAIDLPEVTIGVVGKYTQLQDAYFNLKEAIYHAGVSNNVKVNIKWIEAEKLEEYSTIRGVAKFFDDVSAIIVPGGFDTRGIAGKILAIQYAREKKIPFLGICLGLQCAVIEFARNVCGIEDANSVEFKEKDITPVVHFVPGLEHIRKKGGTLRLGAYDCSLMKDSLACEVYGKRLISERHRHRYEINVEYAKILESNGFLISGINPETELIEVMELDRDLHPYFITVQFHPELKSRLQIPHPLFDKLLYCAFHGCISE